MVLSFSDEQFAAFERMEREKWFKDSASELFDIYPNHLKALGASHEDVQQMCQSAWEYAAAFGISERRDVFKFAVLALSVGTHFCHDPRSKPAIDRSLAQLTFPSNRRLILMSEAVTQWLDGAWEGGGFADFGARLNTALSPANVARFAPETVQDILFPVLPGQWSSIPDRTNVAFFVACFERTKAYGLQTDMQKLAYIGCALAHGLFWFDDPLLKTLRADLEGATSDDELRHCLAAFYGRFA